MSGYFFSLGLPYWLRQQRICLQYRRPGSIPGSRISPGEGNGNTLQYSCLENSMDRGFWWATVHRVAKNWTWLRDQPFHFHFLSNSILKIEPWCSLLSSVQSLSCAWLFGTPWIAAHQASLSITISRSSFTLTSIKLVMPFSHLIFCCPLLLLSIFPSINVVSKKSVLRIR